MVDYMCSATEAMRPRKTANVSATERYMFPLQKRIALVAETSKILMVSSHEQIIDRQATSMVNATGEERHTRNTSAEDKMQARVMLGQSNLAAYGANCAGASLRRVAFKDLLCPLLAAGT